MQAYQPRLGDTVEFNGIMEVSEVATFMGSIIVRGMIKVSESDKVYMSVPLVCVAPFEPEKDSAMNDEVQSMGMEGL